MLPLLLTLLAATPEAPPPILRAPVDRAHMPGVARPVAIAAPAAAPTRAVPTVPLPRLINPADYPAAALKAGEQGNVRVRLDIGTDGRVTGCTITESSRSAILDATTCRILRSRARFTPARDSAGKAAPDRFETAIAWRTGASAQPPVPPAVHAAMTAWAQCIGPAIGKGVGNKALTASAVAEQAFATCLTEENRMLAAIGEAMNAPQTEKDRAMLRAQVVSRIEAARAAKKP
jgi:TonB family protein